MSKEMHVWVGNEDPYELPIGGVTLFIHQGTSPGAGNPTEGPSQSVLDVPTTTAVGVVGGGKSGSGPVVLKPQTPGHGTYSALQSHQWRLDDFPSLVTSYADGSRADISILMPNLDHAGADRRKEVFGAVLDGLGSGAWTDVKIDLIPESDLPGFDA